MTDKPTEKPIAGKAQLKIFEDNMFLQGKGWSLVHETPSMLVYEKIQEAQKGSCLVALVLLILMIIPGILYLYYSNKPAKTLRLSVKIDSAGGLIASGDPEGLKLYNNFQKSGHVESAGLSTHELIMLIVIVCTLIFLAVKLYH